MVSISVDDVWRDPRGFLARVMAGETLVIVKGDTPIAELKPVAPAGSHERPFGLCAGEFVVPADFDAPLPDDVLAAFEGA